VITKLGISSPSNNCVLYITPEKKRGVLSSSVYSVKNFKKSKDEMDTFS
jgi:hypothetical protein